MDKKSFNKWELYASIYLAFCVFGLLCDKNIWVALLAFVLITPAAWLFINQEVTKTSNRLEILIGEANESMSEATFSVASAWEAVFVVYSSVNKELLAGLKADPRMPKGDFFMVAISPAEARRILTKREPRKMEPWARQVAGAGVEVAHAEQEVSALLWKVEKCLLLRERITVFFIPDFHQVVTRVRTLADTSGELHMRLEVARAHLHSLKQVFD